MSAALVLYEDSRGDARNFGPHELLVSLVADEKAADVHTILDETRAWPMNGINNLMKAIKQLDGFRKFAPGGAPILVVVDADKIRSHLKLPGTDAPTVEAAIRSRCDQPKTLAREQIEAAPAKDVNARDLVLTKVARDPGRRALRDCVRKRMPSLEPAIAFVVSRLAA